MNKNLISRYIWLVDTLSTHGKLTREQINELWIRSNLSDGEPLPERTFYHYRRAVEEIFNIEISCNNNGEYYIDREMSDNSNGMTNWLLDSFAVNNILVEAPDIADRIEVEEVPSAREFLPPVINAMRLSSVLRFDYAGFNRSLIERGIEFEPYFLKRYKQRWYMIGRRVKTNDIRTYALDRIKTLETTEARFEIPEGMATADLFGSIVGVTSSKAEDRTVKLRATRTQAKYFRALPLHHSQKEELIDDNSSVFTYRLKLNYELVHEIMSLGDGVKVLEPKELQLMVTNELKKALRCYEEEGATEDKTTY